MHSLKLSEAEYLIQSSPDQKVVIADDFMVPLSGYAPEYTAVFSGRSCAGRFKAAGYEVFGGIEAEPGVETVEKMVRWLEQKKPIYVIAAGGGSVLDAAKAAWMVFQSKWPLAEHFGVNMWSKANQTKKLERIIAVPTTSGTGSESTAYSNIVDHTLGVKKLIVESEILPAVAVISPELTTSMPRELTRATGCDALAHLLEGFLNTRADQCGAAFDPNKWAKLGISLVKEYLPRALKDPEDIEARRGMMYASTLGGMTIRFKSTGLPHLCSFSWFGRIAHGDAVAVLLKECWLYYLGNPDVASRTMELQDIFAGSSPEEVISGCREFLSECGLPEHLAAWSGIDAELLEQTAMNGSQNRMKLELAPRPVPVAGSYDVLKDILQKSF